MKNIHLHLATAILIVVTGVSAQAQSRNRQQMHFTAPFTFNVGNSQLPAGEYTVQVINPTSDHAVLQFRNVSGQASAMVRTTEIVGWANSKGKLNFRHYGDQYFLAQVWMAGEADGLATQTSNAEKTLRQQVGQKSGLFSMVAINAR